MTTDDGRQPEEPIDGMQLILGIGVRALNPTDYKLRNCPFCDSTPEIDRYPEIAAVNPAKEQQRWDGHFDLLMGILGAFVVIFVVTLLVL